MRKKRKLLSLILAAAMVLSLLPASALAAEADAVSSMEETAGAPGAPAEPKLITAWAPLDEPAIEVEPGITEHSLGLPEALAATVDGSDAAVAVTWASKPEYDPDAEGVYIFTAALADGAFALADGLEPPTVTVTVAAGEAAAQDMSAYAAKPWDTDNNGYCSTSELSSYLKSNTKYNASAGTISWPALSDISNCYIGNSTQNITMKLTGMEVYLGQGRDQTSDTHPDGSHFPFTMTGVILDINATSISLYQLASQADYQSGMSYTGVVKKDWSFYDAQKTALVSIVFKAGGGFATEVITDGLSLGSQDTWINPEGTKLDFSLTGNEHVQITNGTQSQIPPAVGEKYKIKTVTITADEGFKLPETRPDTWPETLIYTRSDKRTATVTGYFKDSDLSLTVAAAEDSLFVQSGADASSADGTWEHPYASLEAAYTAASSGTTIQVIGDLAPMAGVICSAAKDVTIQGVKDAQGNVPVVTVPDTVTLLAVSKGSVTLKDITLQGQGKDQTARTLSILNVGGISSSPGALTLGSGATVQQVGMMASGSAYGLLVVNSYGTLTMETGSTVKDLTAYSGCIRVHQGNTKFIMNGGLIQNCDSRLADEGNAIYISQGGKAEMHGGEITGCGKTIGTCNGTVFLHNGTYTPATAFVMDGGSIHDNAAKLGGGVYMAGGSVTLSGTAKIADNEGSTLQGESNVYLMANQSVIVGSGGLASGADIGIYTAGAISNSADVKIATGASAADTDYFHSDKLSSAGVVYCGGGNGNGDVPTGGHHQNHTTGDLYLSTAAAKNDLYVKQDATAEGADGSKLKPYPTLAEAYAQAAANGTTIHVMNDLRSEQPIAMGENKTVTIQTDAANGTPATIRYTGTQVNPVSDGNIASYRGLLEVTEGTVTIKNLTLDADGHAICVVKMNGGDVVLDDGTKLTGSNGKAVVNGTASNARLAGGLLVYAGTATMKTGAEISGNTSRWGPAVTLGFLEMGGTFQMEGGTIVDNHAMEANAGDGGVICGWGGRMVITGGTIADNDTLGSGGAIQVFKKARGDSNENPTLKITGGTITGNAAAFYGGAIHATGGTTIVVSGNPKITDNTKGGDNSASNIYLGSGQYLTVGQGGLANGASIGVYTAVKPVNNGDSGDVKIATGASRQDSTYFHSDNAEEAGILYCDGGVSSGGTDGGLHTHHATDVLLSVVTRQMADVYVKSDGNASTATGTKDKPYPTLAAAYSWAGDGAVIHVMDRLTMNEGVTFNADKSVTIVSDSDGDLTDNERFSIERGSSFANAPMLTVTKGTVTLQNITLDGKRDLTQAAATNLQAGGIYVNGGAVVLDDGAVVTGHLNGTSSSGYFAGGIKMEEGSLTIQGTAKVTGNKGFDGAGIMVRGGTFTMTGGEISKNESTGYGGGLYLSANGKTGTTIQAAISGGSVTGNYVSSTSGGAGIMLHNNSTLSVSGDVKITGNSTKEAAYGGVDNAAGVWLYGTTNTRLTVSGGVVIRDNKVGVTDWNRADGTFTGGTEKNLFLANGQTVAVGSGNLTDQAHIGVYTAKTPSDTADGDVKIATGAIVSDALRFHSDNATEAGVLFCTGSETPNHHSTHVANTLWLSTAAKFAPDVGVDPNDGKGYVKVDSKPSFQYAVLGADKQPIPGMTAVDKDGHLLTADENGWYNTDNGPITFKPIPAGTEITLVSTSKGATTDPGDVTNGSTATVPAISADQLTAEIQEVGGEKKAVVTVSPADPSMKYGLVDKNGGAVSGGDWQSVGPDGKVVFDGLTPGEDYMVVAKPATDNDSTTADKKDSGVTVKTPEEGFTNVTSDSVSRDHGTEQGKGKIVIGPTTVSGQEYAVIDKATGQVVDAAITGDASHSGGWATSSGGAITFDGLDPEKDYEVVTRTPGTPPSIPGPGVSVPAATVKPGDVSNGTDANGKASITVADTDPDTKYAVVDSQGNVVAPSGSDKDGWISGNQDGGPITFPGLNAGDDYKVVTVPKETGDTDPTEGGNDKGARYPENVLTPDDLGLVGPAVKVPAVSEDQLSAGITGEDPNQKANITVSPADKDLSYGLVTKNPDGSFTPAVDWKSGAGGTVSFDGLDPNKEYVVVAKPTTGDGSSASTTDKGGSGTSVKTPAKDFADVTPDSVSRDDGAAEGKDKIVLKPTKTGQEYAVIDKTTGQTVKDENGQPIWKTGTGDTPLEFDGLTPGKDYEVVTRTPGTPASLPGKGVEVPGSTVKDGDVSNGTDASGKASLTVDKTDPNTKYAIVDQNTGKVVAPMGGDLDGWLTGNGGKLEFPGLNAGGAYKVVTVPKDEADTDASGQGGNAADSLYPAGIEDTGKDSSIQNVAGPVKKLPTVSADQLSGGVVKDGEGHDKAQITIQPTDDELYYAVVDSTGAVVGGVDGWQIGSKTGPITFKPLDPNETYEVVALPKKDAPTPLPADEQKDKGTKVHTPAGEQVDAEAVTRVTETTGPNQGKDTINLQPTKDTLEYAVVDKVTGKVVTDEHGEPIWKPGTGADSAVSFGGLDPKREYEVVTRPVVDDGSLSVANQPGLTVKKVGALELTGKVYGPDGTTPVKGAEVAVVVATVDGGYQTLPATTGADGTYTLKAEGVALDQAYAVYVKSGAGIASSTQTFSKTQPQALDAITVEEADSGNTNIIGGAVSAFGKPVAGQAVTIRDKATGEIVTPVSGVTTTTAGGGYTLENLPVGTYIVETSGGGKSGMTEIVVKNGEAAANKAGGYSSANVAAVPGGIVKGNVSGLKAGEKATVSLNVPLYDTDGTTVIGTQTVTAQAEGTGGYWQIAGVPAGSYPVTVATPNGTVTGTATIGADGSVSAVTPGEGVTGTDIKAEGGKLTVATPEVEPEKPNAITGAVVNGKNEPVKNATVNIYNDKGEKVGSATTGDGGGYTVPNNLPDGKYYISTDSADGKNGLTGPIEIKNGQTEGKTTVTVSDAASKLLEGVVTKEDGTTAAAGATVVVKDGNGTILATTKTDANGQYFVGSVPDGAVVSIVTAGGETKSFTVGATTADGAWDGTQTTAKPANAKPVIGPNGAKLPISLTAESGKAAVTVTGPSPAVDNVNGKFEVDASGNLAAKTDSNKPSDGTYTVTVTQNGMEVTSTVTVKNGLIADSAPIKIAPHTVSGTIQYAEGGKPSDAVISIPGWGSAKVNTNTGKYELSNIPDGTYTATIRVTDSGKSPAVTSMIQVTLKVENGAASYENPVADSNTGASVTVSSTNLTVTPTQAVKDIQKAVSDAQSAIDAAKAAPADRAKLQAAIAQVKAAQDAIAVASEEELKQLDSAAAEKLAQALTDLMAGSLDVDASAEGVQNAPAAKDSLEAQKGLLVEQDELESAAKTGTSVDVTLTLKANDVTDEPTSTVNKDLPKVNAIASATGTEKTGLYEVVVEKTTVVKELPVEGAEKVVSETTTTVPQLPVPVTLTLAIPADLLGFRYYAVVRVHNGVAERIPSTATKNTVTFTSSLYSTFAILGSNDVIFDDDAKVEDGGNQGGSTGSGGGSSAGGSVTMGKTDGGKLTISPTDPKEGDKVTITVKPDEGYTLDQLIIKDSKGNEIKYVDNGDGTYTYTQPKGKVAISAAFRKVTGDPHDNGVDRLLTVDGHIAFMQGDPSGSFRPAGSITRAEVAQMFYNLLKDKNVTSDKAFTDVAADAWYAKAVAALAGLGIVNGVGDGAFAPDRTITRAEFAAIATRFALRTSGAVSFTDVSTDHWAYEAIGMAACYGWINGYEDGSFKPDAPIARSEAAKVVNTMLGRSADKSFIDKAEDLKLFPDVAKDYWAFYEITEATNAHDFTVTDGVESWGK